MLVNTKPSASEVLKKALKANKIVDIILDRDDPKNFRKVLHKMYCTFVVKNPDITHDELDQAEFTFETLSEVLFNLMALKEEMS